MRPSASAPYLTCRQVEPRPDIFRAHIWHEVVPFCVGRQRDNDPRIGVRHDFRARDTRLVVLIPLPYECDVPIVNFYRHSLDQMPRATLVFPDAHEIERIYPQRVRGLSMIVIDAVEVDGK